jgi:SAM-dependent methyltransferase
MSGLDYGLQYARFHPDTEAHAERMAAWLRGELASHLPADRAAPVVDVGCGRGYALRALRALGYTELAGVEASPQQAEQARAAGFAVDVTDDTEAWLHARPARFGAALLLDVLEHVPRERQVALLAALPPGGCLVLTVPNANAILASRWLYDDFTHHASFTEGSLAFALANAGFERVAIDAEKGLGSFPKRLWRRSHRVAARKYIVRWLWLQVYKAEMPEAPLDAISFELNLKAVAYRARA